MTDKRNWSSYVFPIIVIAVLIWLALQTLAGDSDSAKEKLRFSEALNLVQEDMVPLRLVIFDSETQEVELRFASERRVTTIYPVDQSAFELQQLLEEKGIPFEAESVGQSAWWSLIASLLPFVLLLGFWVILMRTVRREPPTTPESQETSFLR